MEIKNLVIVGVVGALTLGVGAGLNELTHEPVIKTEVKTVEVPHVVEKEVVKEVEVDNSNLDDVLKLVFENDGDVEYILDELEEHEIDKIVDRVAFQMETMKLAEDAINTELFDEVDGMTVNGKELFEENLERLRVDSDIDEIKVKDADFENSDITFEFTGTFEQNDIEYEFEVDVVFKDGEFDELKNIIVQ